MAQIGSVVIALDVDIGRMSRFRDAARIVQTNTMAMRRGLGQTSTSVGLLRNQMNQPFRSRLFGESLRTITRTNDEIQRLRASMVALSAVFGTGLTAAFAGTYLLQTADRARLLSNQLRTVTTDYADLANIQGQLYDISQRTRSSLEATTRIYARTARATEFFAVSQEKLLRVTETIQKAFAVGGATQAEATGAAIQLSQGIASDRFSGEEFRSVAENAPVLLQNMAKSMGVTIGRLREMAHAGELTGKVVVESILKSSKAIDESFAKTSVTIGQSFTRLDNAFVQFIGNTDDAYGLSRKLAGGLTSLAENFDEVAKYAGLAVGAMTAMFAGRLAANAFAQRMAAYDDLAKAQRIQADEARKALVLNQQEIVQVERLIAAKSKEAAATLASMRAVQGNAAALQNANAKFARQRAELHALQAQLAATRAQTVGLSSSLSRAAVAATRFGVVQQTLINAGRGLLAVFGGLPGILVAGAAAGFFAWQQGAAKAAEQTKRLTEQLQNLGYLTKEASTEMMNFQEAVAQGRIDVIRRDISTMEEELTKAAAKVRKLDFSVGADASLATEMQQQGFLDPTHRSEAYKMAAEAYSIAVRQAAKDSRVLNKEVGAIADSMAESKMMTEEQEAALKNYILNNEDAAKSIFALIDAGKLMNAIHKATKDRVDDLRKAQEKLTLDMSSAGEQVAYFAEQLKEMEEASSAARDRVEEIFSEITKGVKIEDLSGPMADYLESLKKNIAATELLKGANEEMSQFAAYALKNIAGITDTTSEKYRSLYNKLTELSVALDGNASSARDVKTEIDNIVAAFQAAGIGKTVAEKIAAAWLTVKAKIEAATAALNTYIENNRQITVYPDAGGVRVSRPVPGGAVDQALNAETGGEGQPDGSFSVGANLTYDPKTGLTSSTFGDGGYTGPGGKNKVAGVVHAGEFVFDKESTGKIGPDVLAAMMKGARGYADGGYVGGTIVAGVSGPGSLSAIELNTARTAERLDDLIMALEVWSSDLMAVLRNIRATALSGGSSSSSVSGGGGSTVEFSYWSTGRYGTMVPNTFTGREFGGAYTGFASGGMRPPGMRGDQMMDVMFRNPEEAVYVLTGAQQQAFKDLGAAMSGDLGQRTEINIHQQNTFPERPDRSSLVALRDSARRGAQEALDRTNR